jgi:Zn-dependent peptidase ImmA (M78 family)
MSANWTTVKAKAKNVRKKYVNDGPPVNVFDIAMQEGINIVYFTPDQNTADISGFLEKNSKTVYLNTEESSARQNFTLAHELAHYFLEHKPDEYGVYKRNSLYSEKKPEKEQEADLFAAELLMPKSMITKAQKEYGLSDSDSTALAALFGVSPPAMKYRLRSLRYDRSND